METITKAGGINRRILGAMVSVGVFGILVKALALVKELFVAEAFGTSGELDAFIAATVFPLFGVQILGISFAQAFMPAFISEKNKNGADSAYKLAESALAMVMGLLFCMALILLAGARFIIPLVGSGFDPEKRELAIALQGSLLPILVLGGASSVLGAVLNAGGRFAVVALAQAFTPLCTLLLLVFCPSTRIELLVNGFVCGCVVEVLVLGFALAREGRLLLPRWHGMSTSLREVSGQYLPAVAGSLLMAVSGFIDQAMAGMLPGGSMAQLSYGTRIVGVLNGVISTAVGTAILPHYAALIASKDYGQLKRLCRMWAGSLAAILAAVSFSLIIFSPGIIRLVFERGSFNASDTSAVALVQSLFAIQIPFYVVSIMAVRLLTALRSNHLLVVISLVNVTVNVAGNLLFMRYIGVAGIALSTSLVYVVSCFLGWWMAARRLRAVEKTA